MEGYTNYKKNNDEMRPRTIFSAGHGGEDIEERAANDSDMSSDRLTLVLTTFVLTYFASH